MSTLFEYSLKIKKEKVKINQAYEEKISTLQEQIEHLKKEAANDCTKKEIEMLDSIEMENKQDENGRTIRLEQLKKALVAGRNGIVRMKPAGVK